MAITAPSSFSYAPKIQPALASLAPVGFGSGLRFEKSAPIVLRDQNLAAPATGYWQGRQALTEGIAGGILSGLGKVLDAYVGSEQKKTEKKEAKEQSELEHQRAIELANIKAKKTPEEEEAARLYQTLRNKEIEQRINEASPEPIPTLPEDVRSFLPEIPDFKKQLSEIPKTATEPVSASQPTPSSLPPPIPKPTPLAPPAPALPQPVPSPVPPPSGASVQPPQAGLLAELNPYQLPSPKPASLQPILPPSEGTISIQGQEMPLMRVTGAEGELPQPELQKEPDIYDIVDSYTRFAYPNVKGVVWAQDELENKLGLKTKIRTVVDPATKQNVYYLDLLSKDIQKMQLEGAKLNEKGEVTYEYKSKPTPQEILPRLTQQDQKYEILIDTIDRINNLMASAALPAAGKLSDYVALMPVDTAANDIRELLKTVKGQIAFGELMAMKEASKTGASGLGALTEKELALLESLQGAISPSMSAEEFKRNLTKLREVTETTRRRLQEEVALNIADIENQKSGTFTNIQSQPNTPVNISTKEEYDKLQKGQAFYWQGDTSNIGYKQ